MSFVRRFLASLLMMLFAYFVLITFINPHREFYGERFPEITPNSRGRKLKLFETYNAQAPVTGLVLGSSRTMKIDPSYLDRWTGERFFNFGVLAGGTDDDLAIYHFVKRKDTNIRLLLIGIDLNQFHPDYTSSDELNSNLDLQSMLHDGSSGRLWKIAHSILFYKKALNPSYVIDTLKSVRIKMHPVDPINRFVANGHLDYIRWDKEIKAGTFDRDFRVRECIQTQTSLFNSYTQISSEYSRYLEALISEAKADNVKVLLWITPLHPDLLSKLKTSRTASPNLEHAREYVFSLRDQYGVGVYDMSSIQSFHGNPANWYDCTHYDDQDANHIALEIVKHGL